MLHLTQDWNGIVEGPLFKLDSNKRWRAKMQPLFESFPGPLLKSGMGPLARYGNQQEIMRLGQMYTSSDTRLEWPEEGQVFESDSNKRRGVKTGSLVITPHLPFTVLGAIALTVYKETIQQIINLPPELSIMSLIC